MLLFTICNYQGGERCRQLPRELRGLSEINNLPAQTRANPGIQYQRLGSRYTNAVDV